MPTRPEPAQARREETYRGVAISVVAYQQPRGWSWTYVAGDLFGRMRGAVLPTAEDALTQGMNAARARVDRP